jgi:BMFP domain-containing protein YqiC
MTDQHRATPEQWADLGAFASDTRACILELRARIEALEAAQQDKLDRLIALDAADPTPDAPMPELRARTEALEATQRYQFRSATEKVPTTRLYSYSVGPAKPLDELGQGHTLVSPEPASAEAQPAGRLVEMLGDVWSKGQPLHPCARVAAIRTVATWLDRFALHGSGEYAQAAKVLRQEVGQ